MASQSLLQEEERLAGKTIDLSTTGTVLTATVCLVMRQA